MSNKFVYLFTEGNGSMRELLGGKGANLAEMTRLGMPVPQGFTVTTQACAKYYADGIDIRIIAPVHPGRNSPQPGKDRGTKRQGLWQRRKSPAGVGAFRGAGVHAGDDGYHFEPGA